MLRVVVSGTTGAGKSTLAAIITKALRDAGIPTLVVDESGIVGNADFLLRADNYHLEKTTLAVSSRLKADDAFVTVQTVQYNEPPKENV